MPSRSFVFTWLLPALLVSLQPQACSPFTNSSGDAGDSSAGRTDHDSGRADPPVAGPSADAQPDTSVQPGQAIPNPGEPRVEIACGDTDLRCKAPLCCGVDSWLESTCKPSCSGKLRLACDDPEDCPRGSVCCAKLEGSSVVESSCNSAGACGAGELALCVRGEQCGSGHCNMARPVFLQACE